RAVHGDTNMVGIVLAVAYGCFQDRLLLSLGVTAAEEDLLPPVAVRFRRPYTGYAGIPARTLPQVPTEPGPESIDPQWKELDYDGLQQLLGTQQDRPGRIPVPSFDELLKNAPPGTYNPARPVRIKWSLVCAGYQPKLAGAWLNCLRTFGAEADQDRVFEELLFWVVTRSLRCFY
ncbi:MAG: deiodinase family protein, partial [Gemmataceae bacterium]